MPIREILRRAVLKVMDVLGLRLWAIRNRHVLDKLYYGAFAIFDRQQNQNSDQVPILNVDDIPLVSMVFLSYQHDKYIEAALDSAFAQDYPRLEILISDDCSTDTSLEIINRKVKSYSGPHDIYININETNRNWSHLNYAIPKTQGDIIVLACSDDIMRPNRVSRLVAELQTANVSLVGSNAIVVNQKKEDLGLFYPVGKKPTLDIINLVQNFHVFPSLGASIAFRRDVWDRFGSLKEGPREVDMILPFRALLLNGLGYVAEPLFLYTWHDENDNFSCHERLASTKKDLKRIELQKLRNQRLNLIAMEEALSKFTASGQVPAVLPTDSIQSMLTSSLEKVEMRIKKISLS